MEKGLIRITTEKALSMLMDDKGMAKVYFKRDKTYEQAIEYAWLFDKGSNGVKIKEVDFYMED